jgi:hypothetical protein
VTIDGVLEYLRANFGANKKGLQFLNAETLVNPVGPPGLEPGTT